MTESLLGSMDGGGGISIFSSETPGRIGNLRGQSSLLPLSLLVQLIQGRQVRLQRR